MRRRRVRSGVPSRNTTKLFPRRLLSRYCRVLLRLALALVEAGHQRDGRWDRCLHRPDQQRVAAKRSQFLWITRNTPIWGRDAALKRFEENYQGTWLLEQKFGDVKITELSPGVAQLFVPAVFTIAPAGQTAQPRRFLLTQVYVKTAGGWRLATILPFFKGGTLRMSPPNCPQFIFEQGQGTP
jgi:hypothetical protein